MGFEEADARFPSRIKHAAMSSAADSLLVSSPRLSSKIQGVCSSYSRVSRGRRTKVASKPTPERLASKGA